MIFQIANPVVQFGNVHPRQVGDIFIIQLEMTGFALEAVTLAIRTDIHTHEVLRPLSNFLRRGIFVPAIQHIDDALLRKIVRIVIRAVVGFSTGIIAVQNHLQRFLRNFLNRRRKSEVKFLGNFSQLLEGHIIPHFAERRNANVVDAFAIVRNDLIQVHLIDLAQAVAGRASAIGRIERKRIGRRLFVGNARFWVHQVLAESGDFLRIGIHDKD